MTTLAEHPLRYNGSSNSYVDIGFRGALKLGFSIDYAPHPVEKVGCFVLRFVVHGGDVKASDFTHFIYRERARFIVPAEGKSPELFYGYRLNKFVVKAFSIGIHKTELDAVGAKLGTWSALAKWVQEQAEAEGFAINVTNLAATIRGQFFPDPTPGEVENILEFPDLAAIKKGEKTYGPKLVQKNPDDNDDEDPDDDDDDDDEDGGKKKDWLQ